MPGIQCADNFIEVSLTCASCHIATLPTSAVNANTAANAIANLVARRMLDKYLMMTVPIC
jgi:hypothetical protein